MIPPEKLQSSEWLQLQTVNHKKRTSFLFGLFCGVLLGFGMYMVLR